MSDETWGRTQSEAMARVIAASKLKGRAINRKKLAYDLKLNLDLCQAGREAVSPSIAKRKKTKLGRILKSAQKLRKHLADDQVHQIIWNELDISDGDPRDAVCRLIVALQALMEK